MCDLVSFWLIYFFKCDSQLLVYYCSGPFWLKWAGLPPAIWGSSVLSMGVETSPIRTQLGPACAQTMPRLPGTRLRQAKLFQVSCGRQIR